MKVSFGMITRDLLTIDPLDQFLDNANKFDREIHSVVIAYSGELDTNVLNELKNRVDTHLIKIRSSNTLYEQLNGLGMSKSSIENLIGNATENFCGRIAYGESRNHVIIESMLKGSDVLIFVDTDVYPKVIIREKNRHEHFHRAFKTTVLDGIIVEEVDFVGRHLEYLIKDEVSITTSDYSGYYIIPPMRFKGMKELFLGLKKETAYNYINHSYGHGCLVTDHGKHRKTFKTDKVLGGNVAIKLDIFKDIVPFFSSIYNFEGEEYLTRGEDTVLAIQIKEKKDRVFYDIDTRIFHDTYGNFPVVPNIENDNNIKDRFYYACMGWIGRNPFLNYLNCENIEEVYKYEHDNLVVGSIAISEYLNDSRFLKLPDAHQVAYGSLGRVIKEFKEFKKSWFEFSDKLNKGGKK